MIINNGNNNKKIKLNIIINKIINYNKYSNTKRKNGNTTNFYYDSRRERTTGISC